MSSFNDTEDPRRRLLIQALAAGAFSSMAPCAFGESVFGSRPSKLPPGQSIYRINGKAFVNGKEATLDTKIGPNDQVETGKNSELIFVVGSHAMIARSESKIQFKGSQKDQDSAVISGLRMLSGKLLSVSRNESMEMKTKTATIGIRGTGFYVEAEEDLTYFCTCYGLTDVMASDDSTSKDTVAATHHDKPLYIRGDGQPGKNIQLAGFKNHTDMELMLIETLVGRTTPFVFPGNEYTAPRRGY